MAAPLQPANDLAMKHLQHDLEAKKLESRIDRAKQKNPNHKLAQCRIYREMQDGYIQRLQLECMNCKTKLSVSNIDARAAEHALPWRATLACQGA